MRAAGPADLGGASVGSGGATASTGGSQGSSGGTGGAAPGSGGAGQGGVRDRREFSAGRTNGDATAEARAPPLKAAAIAQRASHSCASLPSAREAATATRVTRMKRRDHFIQQNPRLGTIGNMSPISLPSRGSIAAAVVLASTLASASASAVQSAELYRTDAFFYEWAQGSPPIRARGGRGELLLPLEGRLLLDDVLERAFTDYEKVKAACGLNQRRERNGVPKPTIRQSQRLTTYPRRLPHLHVRVDAGLHRLVHRRDAASGARPAAVVAEYTQNAGPGHGDALQRLGLATHRSGGSSTLPSCR